MEEQSLLLSRGVFPLIGDVVKHKSHVMEQKNKQLYKIILLV